MRKKLYDNKGESIAEQIKNLKLNRIKMAKV